MREFDFKPPRGSVYVGFTEDKTKETESGLAVPTNNNPRRNMMAEIVECGEGCEDLAVGMIVIFNRSRTTLIKEGIYCVKEEFIEGEYTSEKEEVPCTQ